MSDEYKDRYIIITLLKTPPRYYRLSVLDEWDGLHPYGITTALMFGNYNNQCIQVIRTGT